MDFLYEGVRGRAMTSPFDMAWALLKSDPTQAKNNAYVQAYSKVRPPNMTDEMYEDHIEHTVNSILNGVPSNKPLLYPWPKRSVFQSTFDLDGSINRDPMVSQQRKLNARMGRESNRREAVPSRIEISPRDYNRGGRDYSLVNDEGEVLSQISGYGGDKHDPHIHDFYGSTMEPYRRQGMYRKLMQALIGAGIPINSSQRNSQSNPFHQKFLENLPPNIMSSYVDEYGNSRTEDSVEDLDYHTPLGYYQNKVPQFLDAQRQRSGLNRRDYGAIPIVNQENQARNMDKLAEQDSAKIRRWSGHIPETQGILVQQPMARNTYQVKFNPNFENEYPPLYSGSYDNDGGYSSVEELGFRPLDKNGNPV